MKNTEQLLRDVSGDIAEALLCIGHEHYAEAQRCLDRADIALRAALAEESERLSLAPVVEAVAKDRILELLEIEKKFKAISAPRQGEPWGWATEGGGLCVGSMRQEWMLDTWFPVYRHAGAPPTKVSHICSDGKEKPWPKAAWCPQCSQPPGPDVLSVDGKPREIMGEASKHGAPPTNKEDDALDALTVAAMRPEIAAELIRDGIPPGEIILSAPPTEASGEVTEELYQVLEYIMESDDDMGDVSLEGIHELTLTVGDETFRRLQAAWDKYKAQLERGGER